MPRPGAGCHGRVGSSVGALVVVVSMTIFHAAPPVFAVCGLRGVFVSSDPHILSPFTMRIGRLR